MTLKKLKLGSSDLYVSEACMGCMMFGSMTSEEDSYNILDAAYAKGVNFFDTAEMYSIPPRKNWAGMSSIILGRWLKSRDIKREDVVISSKVIGRSAADDMGFIVAARTDPPSELAAARLDVKNIEAAVDGELRRLQLDYIDLMHTHWPDRYRPGFGEMAYDPRKERESTSFEEQVTAMAEMIKKGKIRYWALSNETSYGTAMTCLTADRLNCPRPIAIQNEFNLTKRTFESELAEVCCKRHLNLPLLVWSAAGGGTLSGKYLDGKFPEGARMTVYGYRYKRFFSERMDAAIRAYNKIAQESGYTPTQLAYLFCKSRFFVESTIVGATSLEQLEENLGCFDRDLPQKVLEAIDEVHVRNPNPEVARIG